MRWLFAFFLSVSAQAQEGGGDSGGSELSLFVGSFLPNQIPGVTEILPVFGGRYGIGLGGGVVEAGVSNSHAEGVDFTSFSASFRANLPAIDSIVGIVYGGLDLHYYTQAGTTDRTSETGVHVGTGVMMHTSDTLWLRSDLKLNAGPGTALSLLFGLVFTPGASAQ